MTAGAADPPWSRDEELLAGWREMDVPEGLAGGDHLRRGHHGEPAAAPPHSWIDSLLTDVFVPVRPPGTVVAHELDIYVPPISKVYRPDLVVLPRSVLKAGVDDPWIESGHLLLVVEVTSKDTADNDRVWKRMGYAQGGVPLYLMVDRWCRPAIVTLFSEPSDEDYRQAVKVPFGERIMLPEPFNVEVDSSEFQPAHKR